MNEKVFILCSNSAIDKDATRKDYKHVKCRNRAVYEIEVDKVESNKTLRISAFVRCLVNITGVNGVNDYHQPRDMYESSEYKPSRVIGHFELRLDKESKVARFGPSYALGMIQSDHQNRGIGRFCMSLLVKTARNAIQDVDTYLVKSLMLSSVDANDDESAMNRNVFYQHSGIPIEDVLTRNGKTEETQFSTMADTHNRRKVRAIPLWVVGRTLCNELVIRRRMQSRIAQEKISANYYKDKAHEYNKRAKLYQLLLSGSVLMSIGLLSYITSTM